MRDSCLQILRMQPPHPGIPHEGQTGYLPVVQRALPMHMRKVDTPDDWRPVHLRQPGDINNSGNEPELAGLHLHRPVVTGFAECSRLGPNFFSFGHESDFSCRQCTVFCQASHRPDRNPPRIGRITLTHVGSCSSRRQTPTINRNLHRAG